MLTPARLGWITFALLAGCAHAPAPDARRQPAPDYPVIVRIVSRARTITVSAGPRCALYSVQLPSGAQPVSFATLDELRTEHPEYYKWVQPMVASDETPLAGASLISAR